MINTCKFTLNNNNKTEKFRLKFPYLTIKIIRLSFNFTDDTQINNHKEQLKNLSLEICSSNSRTFLKNVTCIPMSIFIEKLDTRPVEVNFEFPMENYKSKDFKFPLYDFITVSLPEHENLADNLDLSIRCEFIKTKDTSKSFKLT